ncbi:hypothetical protein BaRGS_00034019 [Batillaria attramentaria]|uniref:Uncharacterized protein n=1 Tax=Batillaria attramentaria TaxID=370345 RepID=A0ABD0JIR9_9CAEN
MHLLSILLALNEQPNLTTRHISDASSFHHGIPLENFQSFSMDSQQLTPLSCFRYGNSAKYAVLSQKEALCRTPTGVATAWQQPQQKKRLLGLDNLKIK